MHQLQDDIIYKSKISILCDNVVAIRVPKNLILHSRDKHIEIKKKTSL